jgi:chromosome segregation ATPase
MMSKEEISELKGILTEIKSSVTQMQTSIDESKVLQKELNDKVHEIDIELTALKESHKGIHKLVWTSLFIGISAGVKVLFFP